MTKPLIIPADGGRQCKVLGADYKIKIHAHETGGAFAVVTGSDAPNAGTPPHIHHREDETFYVLEGEYEILCGGQRHAAKAGMTVFAPRGIVHCYTNVGRSPGKLLVVLTPGGFEKFFEEVDAMPQQEIQRVIEIGKKYGLEFPPSP